MCYCGDNTKCDECYEDKEPKYVYEVYYTSYIGNVPLALCAQKDVADAIKEKWNIDRKCDLDKAKVVRRVIINSVGDFKR